MKKTATININLGIPIVVFIVFLTLRLVGGVINWSWIWVTSPLWISVGVGLILWFLLVFLYAIGRRKK